jgi:hypothetical protein
MDYLLLIVVGVATAIFVFSPLWGRSRELGAPTVDAAVFNTLPQLEIDRALGKIDEAEYQELRKLAPDEPRLLPVEALIYAWRRTRRLNTAVEAEVLIARARRRRKSR